MCSAVKYLYLVPYTVHQHPAPYPVQLYPTQCCSSSSLDQHPVAAPSCYLAQRACAHPCGLQGLEATQETGSEAQVEQASYGFIAPNPAPQIASDLITVYDAAPDCSTDPAPL